MISCALILVIAATGCGSNGNDVANKMETKTVTIGISMPQIDEITQNLYGSYEAYAETLGAVELIFTDAKGNAKQQSEDIKSPLVYQNIENGKIKAATRVDGIASVKKVLDVCMDLVNGAEIKFDNLENKIIYPQNISLLTIGTITRD